MESWVSASMRLTRKGKTERRGITSESLSFAKNESLPLRGLLIAIFARVCEFWASALGCDAETMNVELDAFRAAIANVSYTVEPEEE